MTLRRARWRAILPLPRAVDRRPTAAQRRPYPARRDHGRRTVRACEAVGHRWRDLHRRAGPGDQFQAVRAGADGAAGASDDGRVFALRLRPNQDFAGALETFCRERGITRAQNSRRRRQHHRRALRGWPRASSRSRPSSRSAAGVIAPGASGALEADLDVALVDYTGGHRRGPADARRQSGADDDGAGAGGARFERRVGVGRGFRGGEPIDFFPFRGNNVPVTFQYGF